MLTRYAGALRGRLHPDKPTFSPAGVPLPPRRLRMGGAHFQDDEVFVATARRDVQRLAEHVRLDASSRLVDWGCGAGRLAVGIAEEYGRLEQYRGIDVQKELVAWAQQHLQRPGYEFVRVDLQNARYNPQGQSVQTIPADSASWDALYAYSVLSHMMSADARAYLAEMARLLRPGGRAFVTLFVEDGVPDEAENPDGYGPLPWLGALHCVRYERGFFERLVAGAGLTVQHFEHGQETDGQSLYVLAR